MNKKFLSAILFGALMVTSTGTFVSCKDYDDDIENLQGQIDKNSSAIAELQKLVGAGNWVTSISPVTGGFTVTMSNGQSQTITGINGADGKDGKNGTEWTIGEDGFWYMDGEKTDNVAIGKNGENGVTAPSPQIVDGYWVVYNWDAEKGEFVAETTEVPAAGTAAYAVEANGVITLHIADANGEYMEIALPATSDSFVVEAPFKEVKVKFETATWTPFSNADKKQQAVKALLAKYPEIAEIEKNAVMKQGGMLPLFVTPANVDLAEGFHFHLQDIYGKFADIELSAPVKGAGNLAWDGDVLVSRSAEEACLWSLEVAPAYDKEKYAAKNAYYASTNGKSSLVAENAKGTVVRTQYAYEVVPVVLGETKPAYIIGNGEYTKGASDVELQKIASHTSTVAYAKSIDLFAPVYVDGKEYGAPVQFGNEYNDKYVITVADALVAEEYGLSIAEDGHTLNIANMPANELNVEIDLNVVVLGLNGSWDADVVTLSIGQKIAATGELAEQTITLGYSTTSGYTKAVRWDIEDLGFTATQLNQFIEAPSKKYVATYIDEEGKEKTLKGTWSVYDEDGTTADVTYKNAVKFGFDISGSIWAPNEYTIKLTAAELADDKETETTVVYAAEGTLIVQNPTFETAPIKVVEEYVEEGVLQIVGAPKTVDGENMIVYNLLDAFTTTKNVVTAVNFVDVANEEYVEANGNEPDAKDMASVNWIKSMQLSDSKKADHLAVYPYDAENVKTAPATSKQVGTVRKIRAEYQLFGNANNKGTFEFDVIVKSAIYSATPEDVITFTAGGLTIEAKDSDTSAEVNTTKLNLRSVASAVYAYGPKVGKSYKLWNDDAVGGTLNTDTYPFLGTFASLDNETTPVYLKGTDGLMIEIEKGDLADFGYTAAQIIEIQKGSEAGKKIDIYLRHTAAYQVADNESTDNTADDKFTLTWNEIWNAVKDLSAVVEEGKPAEAMFIKKATHDDETEYVSGKNNGATEYVLVLNTDAYNAYIAADANNDAETVKKLKLFNKYYQKIAYAYSATDSYVTGATPSKGACEDLDGMVTVEAVDEELAANFITISNTATGSIITSAITEDTDLTVDEVVVQLYLVVKDKWGMTMKVPFAITVEDNRD